MTLGTVTIGEDTTSNTRLYLRGTTTGNTIEQLDSPHHWTFLEKEDSGSWRIGDLAIYDLFLHSGDLIVNGTWTVRNTFTFNGGTLKGIGAITKPIAVPANGVLEPGDPTGTLTIDACTISGTLQINVDTAATPVSAMLVVDNLLDIDGATLNLVFAEQPLSQDYALAQYGTLNGTFATVNNLPPKWWIDYNSEETNTIVLKASRASVFRFR